MRTCPLCNRLFDCEPNRPCWCDSVEKQRSIPEALGSCVCSECLAKKTGKTKIVSQLAPRQGQRPALPFQRGKKDSFLGQLKSKSTSKNSS